MNIDDYEKELGNALSTIKRLISDAQVTMGVVESMLWLISKERERENRGKELEVKE